MQNAAKSYQNAYRLFYAFLKFSKKINFLAKPWEKWVHYHDNKMATIFFEEYNV